VNIGYLRQNALRSVNIVYLRQNALWSVNTRYLRQNALWTLDISEMPWEVWTLDISECLVKCEHWLSQRYCSSIVTNYWNVVSWQKQPARRNSPFFSTAVSRCGVSLELGAGRVAHTRITNSRTLGSGKVLEPAFHGTSSGRLRSSKSDSDCAAPRGGHTKKKQHK
jgi:hypothetical protein